MRVALVDSADPARWGGAEVWLRRTLEVLGSMGHEPLGLARARSPILESARGREWDGRGATLARALREFRPDVCVAVLHRDLRALWWHRRAAPRAVRVMARHLPSLRRSWRRRWLYRLGCHAVWVPSEFMRDLLQKVDGVAPHRIAVFTASAPVRDARPDPPPPPTVVCVGRLSPEKGQDVLLRAFSQLPPPARLVLVGAGPERVRLGWLASELELDGRVEWREFEPDLGAVFSRAHVAVQPSRMESFGLAVLEAMSRGVPLVVSDVGGLPEVVGDCAARVPAADANALAAAVGRLLSDPASRGRAAEAGRRRARERFTPEAERAALEDALRAVQSGGGKAPAHPAGQGRGR